MTSGNAISVNSSTELIHDSWNRCKALNIDPHLSLFSATLPAEKTRKIIKENWSFRKYIYCSNHKNFYDFLDQINSVVFFADLELNLILQKGDKKLLSKLNALNISTGTNFDEKVIGTNALFLAARTQKESLVIGKEHYIEALKDFACIAMPVIEHSKLVSYVMFITEAPNFNVFHPVILRYFLSMQESIINLDYNSLELSMVNEMLNLSMENSSKGIILVDFYNRILRVNEWVVNHLDVNPTDICGSDFKETFPELGEALHCLKTGKTTQIRNIPFLRKSRNKDLFMECQPIKKADQIIGVIVTLIESRFINKMANKVANHNAYFTFDDIIGLSPSFQSAKSSAATAARSTSNVLIVGESGTGKELFAQAIHNHSDRRRNAFVSINCAAIPKELIASELFGYNEGAFTGARKGGAPGKFQLADKGTLFLDEIGEMPIDLQAVLLRVLEEGKVTRLGGDVPASIDVRIIAATNKNLWQSVIEKQFRQDLYYRLNVLKIPLPSLRERQEDLPSLINHFINVFNSSLNKNIRGVSPEAMKILMDYKWPGNIREVRNVIERASIYCSSSELSLNDLPNDILTNQKSMLIESQVLNTLDKQIMEEIAKRLDEKSLILNLLQKHRGNKSSVAKDLGITRTTLYNKLKSLEINP